MAWSAPKTREEKEVEKISEITDSWIGVNKFEDKHQFNAWQEWRKEVFGVVLDCKGLTVPTPWPPETPIEVTSYLEAIREIKHITSGAHHKVPQTAKPWVRRGAALDVK